ncbi:MAG: response regulator, partial [Planctomycetes bacterium]|nr:response regulator [Planctomycetota bacterium]
MAVADVRAPGRRLPLDARLGHPGRARRQTDRRTMSEWRSSRHGPADRVRLAAFSPLYRDPMAVRILVVDDEELSRNFLREALTSRGYEVVTASGGSEAIGLARDQAFDVVISDLVMPGIDGLDLVSLVKDIRPQTSVVLVTAYATVERAAEAMERGASDFIHKPLQADQIHFVIQ